MHRLATFCMLLTTCQCVSGNSIVHIGNDDVSIVKTPPYSSRIGSRISPRSEPVLTAPVSTMPRRLICDESADRIDGMIWLSENVNKIFSNDKSGQVHDAMLCAQRKGAVAAIRQISNAKVAGHSYYMIDTNHDNTVSIPVLATAGRDLTPAFEAVDAGTNVTMTLVISESEWVEMWNSVSFALLARGAMSVLNLGIAVLALEGLVTRIRLQEDYGATNKIMQAGCCVEFVSCTMRGIYHAVGPSFSTTQFLLWQHFFLLLFPIGLEMVTNLLAVSLFIRWGAFSRAAEKYRRLEILLVVIGVLVLSSPVVITIMVAAYGLTEFSLNFSVLVIFFTTAITSTIFLVQGRKLIKRLERRNPENQSERGGTFRRVIGSFRSLSMRSMQQPEDTTKQIQSERRRRVLTRAVRWIMRSGGFQLVQLISLIAMATGQLLYPYGYFYWMNLLVLMVTLGALAQVQAFLPRQRDQNKGVSMRVIFRAASGKSNKSMDMPSNNMDKIRTERVQANTHHASLSTVTETPADGVIVEHSVSIEISG